MGHPADGARVRADVVQGLLALHSEPDAQRRLCIGAIDRLTHNP